MGIADHGPVALVRPPKLWIEADTKILFFLLILSSWSVSVKFPFCVSSKASLHSPLV